MTAQTNLPKDRRVLAGVKASTHLRYADPP